MLLSLLEVVLSTRSGNEPVRLAFERARESGALDDIPGLVYPNVDKSGTIEELVDTGMQRILGGSRQAPQSGAWLCNAGTAQSRGKAGP